MVGRFALADSNVLVHLTNRASHVHTQARHAVQTLERNGANLLYTSQNLAEFWNVCTRPAPSGLDLTVDEAWRRVIAIEAGFGYLPEAASAENKFKALLITYRVRGVQVHDARLAAVMLANGVSEILTFDRNDFSRYTELTVIHPDDLS